LGSIAAIGGPVGWLDARKTVVYKQAFWSASVELQRRLTPGGSAFNIQGQIEVSIVSRL
jgi:hypothetical protein